MPAKKSQYWFRVVNASAIALSYDLGKHDKVVVKGIGGKRWFTGRFTFDIDEPGLEDVTFQLTTHDKLGIFAPRGVDVLEIVSIFGAIVEEAAKSPIKLVPYAIPQPHEELVAPRLEQLERRLKQLESDTYKIGITI